MRLSNLAIVITTLTFLTQLYVLALPSPGAAYELNTMVNYTIVTVSSHCVSRCSPVTKMIESCTTVDCLCTEANIRSFGMCMNCAIGSYNYRLPVTDAQSYLDGLVGSCHNAGHAFESPAIHHKQAPSLPFIRLESISYCLVAISIYTVIELLVARRRNRSQETGGNPDTCVEERSLEKKPPITNA